MAQAWGSPQTTSSIARHPLEVLVGVGGAHDDPLGQVDVLRGEGRGLAEDERLVVLPDEAGIDESLAEVGRLVVVVGLPLDAQAALGEEVALPRDDAIPFVGFGPRPSGLSTMFQWPPVDVVLACARARRPRSGRSAVPSADRGARLVVEDAEQLIGARGAGAASLWNEEGFTGDQPSMVESLSSCLFPRSPAEPPPPSPTPVPSRSGPTVPERPDPRAPLTGAAPRTDLLVVGGGFTGLWAAIQAKEADPSRDVVVVEAGRLADGASGRNGGFMAPSLTHGLAQGVGCWPDEMGTLDRLATENFAAIERSLTAYGIDADFHVPGELTLALTEHQVSSVRESFELHRGHGVPVDAARRRAGAGARRLAALPGRDVRPRRRASSTRRASSGAWPGLPSRSASGSTSTRAPRDSTPRATASRVTLDGGSIHARRVVHRHERVRRACSSGSARGCSRSTTTSS